MATIASAAMPSRPRRASIDAVVVASRDERRCLEPSLFT